MSEASRRAAEVIVEQVIYEMIRSDVGVSVKNWDEHVRRRRANAAQVVDTAIARAVAEKDVEIARLRGSVESTALWMEQEPARMARAVEGERERCAAWIMAEGDRLKDMTPDERPFAVQALWNAAAALRAPGEKA